MEQKTLQTSWRMRPATADDAGALSRLAFRSKASWGYGDAFMAQCRNELTYSAAQINSSASEFQVCTMNGEILGFYALEQIDRVVFELEALFVEPGFIGKGIGRFMLDHAQQMVTLRGGERIVIQGDPHAEPFYLAAGAVICGTRESASIAGRLLPLYELHLAKKPDTGRNQ